MLLKSIEIQGFKSFPDKTTLLFGSGITAVVGPNGSGKSNISDAVRWVLGEQSTRSLRGLKMEDVIFGGTAARRPLGFAEVSLHIDNSDRRLPFDQDEVQITRRYYRSGESEYAINRATVRLKDIHELFMDTGLGRDGYSMIGQGKIDSIVASKSEERRDIFEEAAGISRFRYRKLEAERRLHAAEENLLRLRDIVVELESRVGPLKDQSEKAQKFLEYAGEKRELEIGLWLLSLSKFKEQLREQEYKITLAGTQYAAAGDELERIEAELEQVARRSEELIVEVDNVRRAAADCEEEAVRTEGEAAVLQNTVFHNNETIARIERDREQLASAGSDIAQSIDENQAAIEQKNAYIAAKKDELQAAQSSLISLQTDNAAYSQKIEKISFLLNDLSAKVADFRVKMVTAASSATELEGRRATAQKSVSVHEQLFEELQQESTELESDLARCGDKISECQNALKGYEYRLSGRKERAGALQQQVDKLRLDSAEKARRAQLLEDLEKNLEGFAHSVKQIMKESSRGTLRGIHGPLSRIITVPSEYAVAVEVALAAAMQNIVVGTEEDAKRAIQFLKEQNGGRATFLPISSIKGRTLDEQGLDAHAGFVGVASELVGCESRYLNIVQSFLGRVVVAEDLDSAVVIAKKHGYRFKVVTLDGQVINSGGSLTGGSLTKSAGLLGRSHEIEKLRQEAASLQKKMEEAEVSLKSALAEQAACEADIVAARAELATAQEDRIRVESEQRRVAQQVEAERQNIATLKTELETADERLQMLKKQEQEAADEIDGMTRQQLEKEQELRTLTGGRDELSAGRERLSEDITAIRLSLLSAEKDVTALTEAIAELHQRRQNEAGRAQEMQAEIDKITQENSELAQKIEERGQAAAALREQAAGAGEKIAALNLQRAETEKQGNELRVAEREKLAERERTSGELARLEERKVSMMTEYDEIVKKLFDEYELTRSEAEEIGITIEDTPKAQRRLQELKSKIRDLGSVNVAAIEEYKEVSERYTFLTAQIADVEKTRAELYRLIDQLTKQMQEVFVLKFETINGNFSKTFVDLFGGGTASLKMTNPENVLETGIEIIVQPPGKNISIIEQLSGGEKALIAIAIYFAIMKVNPPPFCMLDEVEAALDDVNVVRFAEYLRLMSGATQFIVITHRRGTMEGADVLYGVTMQEKGVSKLLQLNVSEIERQLEITA